MATKGMKATERAAKLLAGREAIENAAKANNSSQLKSALLGYVSVLEQTHTGLTVPGNKDARRKVVAAFVKEAVGLRGFNIAPLYADTLTELAGKNQDAAGQFFCGAPELYHRLGPRYVQEFVAKGLGDKSTTPDYFAGAVANLNAQSALHDLVEKEHLEYVASFRKLGDEFKEHKAGVVKYQDGQKLKLQNARIFGITGTIVAGIVTGLFSYNAGRHRPSSFAVRDSARIEQLEGKVSMVTRERDAYQRKLSNAEQQRDLAQAGLPTTYGARIHDAIENPQSLMEITDEYLESIGGRVRIYGPGCETALGNLHLAMSGYQSDKGRFVQALNDAVCPGVSSEQRYVEFSK